MLSPTILVKPDKCTGCGTCVSLCDSAAVFELNEDKKATVVRPQLCWQCGQCVAACPTNAISHSCFPLEQCLPSKTLGPSCLDALATMFRTRRSVRLFQDKPVDRAVVEQLIDLSRWVPSSQNEQSVDWLVFDDSDRIDYLSKQAATTLGRLGNILFHPLVKPVVTLVAGKQTVRSAAGLKSLLERSEQGYDPIFYHAPVVLMGHGPKSNRFGRDNAIYSAYNIMLGASQLGLGTCQIGYFIVAQEFSRKLKTLIALPQGRRLEVVLILGYPRFKYRRTVLRRLPNLVWNAEQK